MEFQDASPKCHDLTYFEINIGFLAKSCRPSWPSLIRLTITTMNSSRPRNMARVSAHRAASGIRAEVTPTERPTVPRAEANSKRESLRLYPQRHNSMTPPAKVVLFP